MSLVDNVLVDETLVEKTHKVKWMKPVAGKQYCNFKVEWSVYFDKMLTFFIYISFICILKR